MRENNLERDIARAGGAVKLSAAVLRWRIA